MYTVMKRGNWEKKKELCLAMNLIWLWQKVLNFLSTNSVFHANFPKQETSQEKNNALQNLSILFFFFFPRVVACTCDSAMQVVKY